MKKYFTNKRIVVLLLCLAAFMRISAQPEHHMYTDREYCLSGDTVWFKVWMTNSQEQKSNVVRVQFAALNGSVISTVAVQSRQAWADGFIHVPDSLSSGVYTLLAFFNMNRQNTGQIQEAKTLFVYNRFEEELKELEVPLAENLIETEKHISGIAITTAKEKYNLREKIEAKIRLSNTSVSHAVVSLKVVDPLAGKHGGYVKARAKSENDYIPAFAEKDGLLLSGKIVNSEGIPQSNALTLLTISTEPPYFDYFLSDKNGSFHFFLKQARGNANVVFQAINEYGNELDILPETNHLQLYPLASNTKILSRAELEFIKNVVQANFINKLFYGAPIGKQKVFEMPQRYTVPFYGNPSKQVLPREFFDLPDFQEISRELLMGVQYRVRNDEISIRLSDHDQSRFFDKEPLRLLNGIPVFKNRIFSDLKSTDIDYIDIVQEQRVFGDLRFSGVFAVSLYDKSNAWITRMPNILQVEMPCLQINQAPAYAQFAEISANEPDLRQTFLWQELPESGELNFSAPLSDVKGTLEIVVEGHTTSNEYFRTSKLVEVK